MLRIIIITTILIYTNIFAESAEQGNIIKKFDNWIANYYRKPEPKKLVLAIEAMHNEKIIYKRGSQSSLIAFIATILKDNPSLINDFGNKCSFLDKEEKPLLAYALWFCDSKESIKELKVWAKKEKRYKGFIEKSPPLLVGKVTRATMIDVCSAVFFATGDCKNLDPILDCLAYHNEKRDPRKIAHFGAARFTIYKMCLEHKVVLTYCQKELKNRKKDKKKGLQDLFLFINKKRPIAELQSEIKTRLKKFKTKK